MLFFVEQLPHRVFAPVIRYPEGLTFICAAYSAAFVGSVVVLLAVMLANSLTGELPTGLAGFINYFTLSFHFESFSRGLLDSRDIAFFLITTIFFLFLNTQVLVYRRWK